MATGEAGVRLFGVKQPPRTTHGPSARAGTVHRPRAWRRVRTWLFALAVVLSFAGLSLASCGWWYLETRTAPAAVERKAPAFSLPDHTGRQVSLQSLLDEGPAVVVFYRGHW